ncbi:MAG: hypothetical protein QXP77_03480 [Candidatus Aenigmatarchaeota archaeon]
MEEYESRGKALLRACKLLEIKAEKIKSIEPKATHYFFPIDKTLQVYQINENLSFGIGFTSHNRGKFLWIMVN